MRGCWRRLRHLTIGIFTFRCVLTLSNTDLEILGQQDLLTPPLLLHTDTQTC